MCLMAEPLVEAGVEESVALRILRQMRRACLIDLPGNAAFRREALTDEVAAGIAERGDEHKLVVLPRGELAKRIVEQNRSRLRRHELIGLLQDLPKHEIEIDIRLERQTALVP